MEEKTANKKSKIISFPQDSIVLKEGDVNPDMYKIIKGHAEVYVGYGTDNESLIGIIGPRACFGEYGLLLKKPAIYTVVAYSDLYLLRITEGEMADFIQENHNSIMTIMRNMAGMMSTMRVQIDLLLKDLEKGKKPDTVTIQQLRRSMRGYSIYEA
jgi:CRP-like cAMP-binding protein